MQRPSRRHPHRFQDCDYERLWQPVYFTVAIDKRRPVLTRHGRAEIVIAAIRDAEQRHSCATIAYCVMPDHIHVLACVTQEGANVREFFEHAESLSGHRLARTGIPVPVWQRSYFDRHLRRRDSIEEVVAYILDNPVVGELCASRDAWPWMAFLGYPWEMREMD